VSVRGLFLITLLCVLWVVSFPGIDVVISAQKQSTLSPQAYFPLILVPKGCPSSSQNQYQSGPAFQYDLDDPVRPAELHADKNLDLRSYVRNGDPGLRHDLVNYGSDDPVQPPQLATLFNPAQVGAFVSLYQVNHWLWAPSPDPGQRSNPIESPPVTALAIQAEHGTEIQVPSSGYDIGAGMEVIVLYADENSVTLRYTREDSSGSAGYTLIIDAICTDPNLLGLYDSLDAPNGSRYVYVPPGNRPYSYDLPTLPAGQPIGTVFGSQLIVAVSDSGAFQDPRSCNEWWQIRPGYGNGCSR
jgi:hypothetical protein